MNIRRGAFRLWVVLSVLWAGLIVAIAVNDEGIPSLRKGCNELRSYVVDGTGKRLGDEEVRACEAQWQARRTWIAVVLIGPPIGLLLVGLTFGWVARGFRST